MYCHQREPGDRGDVVVSGRRRRVHGCEGAIGVGPTGARQQLIRGETERYGDMAQPVAVRRANLAPLQARDIALAERVVAPR